MIVATNSNAAGGLVLDTMAGAPIRCATGGLAFSNERMRIDSSGNVGIGTTAPSEKLEVNGNIKIVAGSGGGGGGGGSNSGAAGGTGGSGIAIIFWQQ